MIPAILSCVFVAYLYKTLNAEAKVGDDVADAASPEDRLLRLQQRIEQLTKRLGNEGDAK